MNDLHVGETEPVARRGRKGKRNILSFPLEEFRPIWDHFNAHPEQAFRINFASPKDAREIQISYYRLRRLIVDKGWHMDPMYGLPREIDSIVTRITKNADGTCVLTFEHANHSRTAVLLRAALQQSMAMDPYIGKEQGNGEPIEQS